jgi:hypothetical protein
VWHGFLPRESSCWSSGSAGRWLGRAGPACQQGGTTGRPQSVWLRAIPLNRLRCELAVNLDGLRLDSPWHGGDESPDWHAIATCQGADLALLEEASVAYMSVYRAVGQLSWVQDHDRRSCNDGSYGGPIDGAGLQIGRQRVREMRQQGGTLLRR